MARLWILSDLHQEFVNTVYKRHPATRFDPVLPARADEVDIVIAAGDVDVPLSASLGWLRQHFPRQRLIYVAGNHDFYRRYSSDPWTMESLLEHARITAVQLGIHFLENDVLHIDDVRFIGATLWTDFVSSGSRPLGEKVALAQKGMTDYRQIMVGMSGPSSQARRLKPEDTIDRHTESRRFIETELARPFSGKSVVITHHAPHGLSLNPRFGGHLDWCFASDLGEIFSGEHAPDLWVHGHVHQSYDYIVGRTRIIANPRGYAFVGTADEGRGFNPYLVIDTDDL